MVGNAETMQTNGTPEDYSRYVLVLYRKRSGETGIGDEGAHGAGSFLIQRLEGSRFGMLRLWILNDGDAGASLGNREGAARGCRNRCW